MNSSPLLNALTRVERLLFAAPVLEAFIARREAGETAVDDVDTADALASELLAHQSSDGSWGASLALTSEALHLLADLRPFQHDVREATRRAVVWLRTRQRGRGSFVDTCTPDRHQFGICRHFAGGFFSPGPRDVSFAGATLSTGARFSSDDDARLGLSAFALRAVLGVGDPSIDDVLHIEALLRLAEVLFREQVQIGTPAAVSVLCALASAPRSAAGMTILHGAFSRLAELQRADGSWPGAEGFHVADAFLVAARAGYGSPLFDRAITRTAESLLLSQQADGSWGHDAGPQRMLIAWRTLRFAAGIRSSRGKS
jgi:hypothetical protein